MNRKTIMTGIMILGFLYVIEKGVFYLGPQLGLDFHSSAPSRTRRTKAAPPPQVKRADRPARSTWDAGNSKLMSVGGPSRRPRRSRNR